MNVQGKTAKHPEASLLVFPRPSLATRHLLVPREHGSWGLWLFPLVSGAVVGLLSMPEALLEPVLWLLLTAFSAFLIYQPLESILGLSLVKARSQQQLQFAILWVTALAIAAAIGVAELIHLRRSLVLALGLIAVGCFGIRMLLGPSRTMRVPKQVIGALGLSSTAAGAYYAATGQIGRTGLLLWLASWLFAVGQIEYVHLRLATAQVRSRREKARSSLTVCFFHLLMAGGAIGAALAGLVPLFLGLAFIPSLIRLAVWVARPWRPLGVRVLGVTELLQGLLFSVLLIGAFLVRG